MPMQAVPSLTGISMSTDQMTTPATARAIGDAVLERVHELRAAPPTEAVPTLGGHKVAVVREDGSGILRLQIAIAKARGPLGMASRPRRSHIAPLADTGPHRPE